MKEPLVSIDCLTYNQENFIRQALDGFLMQKTDFSFEVLVHDDASSDNTANIIREYEKKYPDIIKPIYQTENQFSKGYHMSATFNFPRVKGKYVALCEGDDYWTDPLKLQKQVDFLETHPDFSMCFHPVKVVYEDGSKPDEFFPSAKFRFNKTVLSLDDLVKQNFIQTNSVMYRWMFEPGETLEVFPLDILPGDWYMHLLCAQYGPIGYIDEVMSVYRRHSAGVWSIADNIHRKYGFQELNFYKYIDKHFNYRYTEIFTRNASDTAGSMIKTLNKYKEYDQLERLQNEYEKYYLNALKINRIKSLKKIISAPERYIRQKIRSWID